MSNIKKFSIIVLFLSLNLKASHLFHPMMSANILKKELTVTNDEEFNQYTCSQTNLHINEETRINSFKGIESFNTNIECQYECKGVKSVYTVDKVFSSLEHGLYEGDGSSPEKIIWRSLGHTLNLWGKETCLNEIQKKCQDIEKLELTKISSGNWKIKGDYSCQNNKLIISPFSKNINIDANKTSNLINMTQARESDIYKFNIQSHIKNNFKNLIYHSKPKNCQYISKVKTCFGDCVFLNKDKEIIETLMTNEPLGDYVVYLCLDNYKNQFINLETKVEKDILCQRFIWDVVMQAKLMGTSCAAFRYDFTCPFKKK